MGGIARTVEWGGYRFDLGGHRFFTKLAPIARLWEEMLGDEFLTRPRLSRIYYQGKFLAYPLVARDVMSRLGIVESARCALSYLVATARPRRRPAETFEEWVTERFGRRLYDAFFRSYTEKVWGIPGTEIRAEWAAQRIRNFSLFLAMLSILGLRRSHVTTLIEEFRYPRLGPGQMWEAFRDRVEEGGVPVALDHRCVGLHHEDGRVRSISVRADGVEARHAVDGVVSSIPLGELVQSLSPAAPEPVLAAARRLRYRALCLVALVTDEPQPFPDNWIYLHDAGRARRAGAELRRLEPGHGAPRDHLPRGRVLLLPGGRHLDDAAGGGGGAGHRRAGPDRPDRPRPRDGRGRRAGAEGLSDVRRATTPSRWRSSGRTSRASRTSRPAAATASTATTTRTTRCGRRCSRP